MKPVLVRFVKEVEEAMNNNTFVKLGEVEDKNSQTYSESIP